MFSRRFEMGVNSVVEVVFFAVAVVAARVILLVLMAVAALLLKWSYWPWFWHRYS